ncbi:MAG: SagB/ThcOx family dehydrogenase [Acidimicrobiales bacterium]
MTDTNGHRTAPSAGATYPLELYVITADAVAHCLPDTHTIEHRSDDQTLGALAGLAFDQTFVSEAPAVVVITGVAARTEEKYGDAARDFVNREAGHAAQNVLLQATATGLSAVPVGWFRRRRGCGLARLERWRGAALPHSGRPTAGLSSGRRGVGEA